jgi:hypothetical protein
MADPSNLAVVDELSFRTGRRIKIVLAGDREITSAVRRLYYADEDPWPVTAIPLEEISSESPLETTRDAEVLDAFTPPPILLRDPCKAATGGPASARAPGAPAARPDSRGSMPPPLAPLSTPPADLLGEPILATDLAPAEDEEHPEITAVERQLTPRESAMLDALERAAQGGESGLVRAGHLAAVLARLLVKRGILSERELLDELMKK